MLCRACGAANAESSDKCAKCGVPLARSRGGPQAGVEGIVIFAWLLKCVGVIVFLISAYPFFGGLLKTYCALGGASAAEKATMLSEGISESFRSGLPWIAGGAVFCIVIFVLSRSLIRDARRQHRGPLK